MTNKQEPVAHLLRRQDRDGYETGEKTDYGAFPVYTQREWVGLTMGEVQEILNDPRYQMKPLIAHAVETKLKEKNT